jgi:hypothetical protein
MQACQEDRKLLTFSDFRQPVVKSYETVNDYDFYQKSSWFYLTGCIIESVNILFDAQYSLKQYTLNEESERCAPSVEFHPNG